MSVNGTTGIVASGGIASEGVIDALTLSGTGISSYVNSSKAGSLIS
jgi:hypothetical protein